MSTVNFNQFHNEDLQDSVLQEQFSTAAAVQELSDTELESVAGGRGSKKFKEVYKTMKDAALDALGFSAKQSDNDVWSPGSRLGLVHGGQNINSWFK